MKKALRIGVAVIIMVALVLGYYKYLSQRNVDTSQAKEGTLSEVQAIIDKDFVNEFPSTPRATVKWYNRIITALYAEEYSDDEFVKMADQLRSLLDEELLNYNPRDQYLMSLLADVTDYKNRKKVIISSSVCDTDEVTYATVNGDEVAYVNAYYFTREGSSYARTYQDYCLRKDASGHWRILTFRLSTEDHIDD